MTTPAGSWTPPTAAGAVLYASTDSVPRDTSLGTGRTRAVLDAEPPSLLDTLRGLALERRIADVRIAATDAMT